MVRRIKIFCFLVVFSIMFVVTMVYDGFMLMVDGDNKFSVFPRKSKKYHRIHLNEE